MGSPRTGIDPTIGVYLIFAAVALRGAVVFSEKLDFLVVVVFLSAYGLLLLAETWAIRRTPLGELPIKSSWLALVYFVLQTGLVVGLLVTPPFEDFFALLFVPLSLDGVAFFGRRSGYLFFAFFSLALTGSLVAASLEGPLFGLAMGIFTVACASYSADMLIRSKKPKRHVPRTSAPSTNCRLLTASSGTTQIKWQVWLSNRNATVWPVNCTIQSPRLSSV
jgi:hypothetical protein